MQKQAHYNSSVYHNLAHVDSPLIYLPICQCLNCFILYCYDAELLCFMHSIQDWSSVSKRMHGPYLISNHCTSPHYCICKFLFYITLLNYIVFPYWTYHIALIVFPLFTNMLIVTMKNSFSSVINDFYLWFTCSGRSAEEHCIYSFFYQWLLGGHAALVYHF